jgi:2-methylisocitrate lyase-like PEP mutase family enzyme
MFGIRAHCRAAEDPVVNDLLTKARTFRALHERREPFLLPNPWDVGSARLLAGLGFAALATTSLGLANALGRRRARRAEVLENCRAIAEATPLPLNADLEDGFAAAPEQAAAMIGEAWRCGVVGASIEDASVGEGAVYDFSLAVERVQAAVEAARALPIPFVLTARAENFLYGIRDLDATIRRLQAFEAAGADVLYAPGLRSLDEMRAVVSSVARPINVVMGFVDASITLEQLAEIGVRRVSIGGALSRTALAAFFDAARAMRQGRFGFVRQLPPIATLQQAFAD